MFLHKSHKYSKFWLKPFLGYKKKWAKFHSYQLNTDDTNVFAQIVQMF